MNARELIEKTIKSPFYNVIIGKSEKSAIVSLETLENTSVQTFLKMLDDKNLENVVVVAEQRPIYVTVADLHKNSKISSNGDKLPHLYHAGRIFSEATFNQRELENKYLELLLKGYGTKFSPLFDNPANEKDDPNKLPTAKDIFQGDTDEVIKSDLIYAELDGEDSGVIAELGICYGVNYMLDLIKKALSKDETDVKANMENILNLVPKKKIYATISDIRRELAGKYEGEHVPVGYNQFVVGMVEEMGSIDYSFEESINKISKDIRGHEVVLSKIMDLALLEKDNPSKLNKLEENSKNTDISQTVCEAVEEIRKDI